MATKSKGFKETGKCSKCGHDSFRKEALTMGGKHGVIFSEWHFDVYVCNRCGFSEFYLKEKAHS